MRLRVLADIPESPLSDICQHPPPRLAIGRLKRSKIKKPPLAVKKTGCSPEQKELLWEAPPQQPEAPPQPSPGEGWDGASIGWYAPRKPHYLSAAHIATMMTFDSALLLMMSGLWIGYGFALGTYYVDVVGVGWGSSWLVRTPGNSVGVAIT